MNDQRGARSVGDNALAHARDDSAMPVLDAASVLASISDGIIAVDNDWRIVYLNPAGERLWGRAASTVIGQTIHEALDIAADNPFRLVYATSKSNNEPVVFSGYSEVFGAWVEGRGYPHSGGYTIMFRPAGDDRARSGIIQESERERTAIRSINQRIFDTSLDLILVVSKRGAERDRFRLPGRSGAHPHQKRAPTPRCGLAHVRMPLRTQGRARRADR